MTKERNFGIELLRLVLMYMVCMLHTLGQGGILGASGKGTASYMIFWFLEILSYCAVDGFALISGYTAVNKPRRYSKLAEMWFQAFFYSFIVTILLTAVGLNGGWENVDFISCIFPVIHGKFWYLTAFFLLFLAIPLLNKFVFGIDIDAAKKALLIIFVLFSIIGIFADPFKTHAGYSAIWLIVLYVIGALARRVRLFEKTPGWLLIIIWFSCLIITWAEHVFTPERNFTNYISPTILVSGMIMVILFSRIRLKSSVVTKFSPYAFGIYLFQISEVIWNNIIHGATATFADCSPILGILETIGFAFLIFVTGLAVEFIRSSFASWLRIPQLCKKIVWGIDYCLNFIARHM